MSSRILELALSLLKTLGASREDFAAWCGCLGSRDHSDARLGTRDIQSLLECPVCVCRPVKANNDVVHPRRLPKSAGDHTPWTK